VVEASSTRRTRMRSWSGENFAMLCCSFQELDGDAALGFFVTL
jgi:hypothetical protein